ncbi:MAG: PucR family transcriptional regulator ligand-binding domain-containing protein [Alicyclobacillus sp.]|nr:PucR family transcriptional regulator ligand-binding domain-containing protein [Alicyclobacillus sp.]
MAKSPFTVERMLQLPVMQDAKVVGGLAGLVNEIRCVDVVEVPDVHGWLRKGEFVLTTGYSFRSDPNGLCKIIEEMRLAEGAAVGFKPKRFLEATPPEAIQLSNQHRIPLIEIPPAIPYIEITQPIMEQILDSQLAMMREIYRVNGRFAKLLATERGQELLDVLGQLLGCETALLTTAGSVEMRTAGFRVEDVQTTRDVCSGQVTLATLALTRSVGSENAFEDMCLEQVVALLSLNLTAKRAGGQPAQQVREQFLVELLSDRLPIEGVLQQRARQCRWPIGPAWAVALVEPAPDTRTDSRDWVHLLNLVSNGQQHVHGQRSVATVLGQQLVFACALTQQGFTEQVEESLHLVRQIVKRLEEMIGIRLRAVIGEPRRELRNLVQSYEEAKRALEVAGRVGAGRDVLHWTDFYVEDLLWDVREHPSLSRLCRALILPIEEYDKENGTDLLRTLDAYLRCGGNTRQVAEELFVHRNSVHYRLERIQDIIGKSLSDPETAFRLNLCLRAWKLGFGT